MRECQLTLESEMSAEEQAYLLSMLGKFAGTHLEIGTAAGGSLWRMMQCYKDGERPAFVVVDPMRYFPDQLGTVKRNLREHGLDPEKVDFRTMTSREAFKEASAKGERFDFMLVDGNHRIMAVTEDLNWTRLVNVGGVMCFHDYSWMHKGVLYAVRRFLKTHRNFEVMGQRGCMLAVKKTGADTRAGVPTINRLYAAMWYLPLEAGLKYREHFGRGAYQAQLKRAMEEPRGPG